MIFRLNERLCDSECTELICSDYFENNENDTEIFCFDDNGIERQIAVQNKNSLRSFFVSFAINMYRFTNLRILNLADCELVPEDHIYVSYRLYNFELLITRQMCDVFDIWIDYDKESCDRLFANLTKIIFSHGTFISVA